ncbi:hypothetical protein [Streptomyces lydicus]|uniref:hypothetical protein n=1 Tax=Streptomyces lydicus TaxID=47763 RepID=UPI0037B2CBF7
MNANNPDCEDARDKAAEMVQEDDYLLCLTAVGALSPDYRVSSGSWEGGQWLAARWIDGVPLRPASPSVADPKETASVRPWLAGIPHTWTEHLARVHAAGWAHADVQPTNTLVTHDGHTEVIDYALDCAPTARRACRTGEPSPTPPLLRSPPPSSTRPPTPQPAADIWSLGASLFWCRTGHRPVAYDDTTERLEKLAVIAKGTTTALRDERLWPFPEFEDAVIASLAPDPADRPTAKERTAAW